MSTTCARYHELIDGNVRMVTLPSGRQKRVCLACERIRTEESRVNRAEVAE